MLQDQKEALLEDPSMTSWIRLFIYGFYRNGQWMEQQEETTPPTSDTFSEAKK